MNSFVGLPAELRVAIIAAIGLLFVGPFTTWAIANWSHFGVRNSPWNRLPDGSAHKRSWFHFIPILGWLFRIRERDLWSNTFWLRPAFIELAIPFAMAGLYWWEVEGGLLPAFAFNKLVTVHDLHWQVLGHLVLLPLLVIATFIDFDEMYIPDLITVPGTLLAVVGSVLIPQWHLYEVGEGTLPRVTQLQFMSPESVPGWANTSVGLWIALLMFIGWCFALADRRIILRRGLKKCVLYFCAGLFRTSAWKTIAAIAVVGSFWTACVYFFFSETAWLSLFNTLCGVAIGGGIVWVIRIASGLALRTEALGFGDVLLMSMVGAYIGWQPVAISFFYAPLFALPVVLIFLIVTGQAATPFGPYLCMATMYCIVRWDEIWNSWLQPMVSVIGGLMPIAVMFIAMAGLMGAMLSFYRIIKLAVIKK